MKNLPDALPLHFPQGPALDQLWSLRLLQIPDVFEDLSKFCTNFFLNVSCSSNALFSASLSFRMFIFHLKKQLCHMTFCNKSKCSLFNKSK